MKIDINYLFAFLHGIIHPLTILAFATRRTIFLAVVLAAGVVSLLEYWLLGSVLKWEFVYTKGVLAVTTAIIGFTWILGFRVPVLLGALLTGILLSSFSHVMLEKVITTQQEWNRLFPVLVIGQLTVYFVGFMMIRWWITKST